MIANGPHETMTGTMFCGACDASIPASARVCPACAARQGPPAAAPAKRKPLLVCNGEDEDPPAEPSRRKARPTPPSPDVATTASRSRPVVTAPRFSSGRPVPPRSPGAAELAGELAERLRTPGVVAATQVAATALVTCILVGALTAIASPDATLVGAPHRDEGIVIEAVRTAVATTLAMLGGADAFKLLPMVFAAAPLLGAALGARIAAPALAGMTTRDAVAWSASGAIVFAAGMVILALVANSQPAAGPAALDFSIWSVLLNSLLLGGAGAGAGALRAAPLVAPDRRRLALPPVLSRALRISVPSLVGLTALVAVAGVVGFAHLKVQTLRGQQDGLAGRSATAGAVENVLFAPDRAVDSAGLALLARFKGRALPVDDDKRDELARSLDGGSGRIFDYSTALPIFVFLPEVLVLMGAALLAALYGGYGTARRAVATTQVAAVGWGALTGVVWAAALTLLRALAFGQSATGASVFANALAIGTLAGAAGGLLAFKPAGSGDTDHTQGGRSWLSRG